MSRLNPEAYLRLVLEHIADYSIHRIEDLLPRNIKMQSDWQEAA
ncbi:transposase domain-containing protein [Burkholderia territorii]